MYMYTQGHSRLISTGAYIPETVVTSRELMQEIDSRNRLGLPYDWLERTTGIRERRTAPPDMLPSDLAVIAARAALERAHLGAEDLDVIIFSAVFRDFHEPATAHVVQCKLGARQAVAFDVSNACHGFVNGMHLLDALIATGQARRGMVVTGEPSFHCTREAIARIKTTTERAEFMKLASGLTLGDAGAAVIMGPKLHPDMGFKGFMLKSQSQHYAYSVCGRKCLDNLLVADMVPLIKEGIQMVRDMNPHFMKKLGWEFGDIAKCVNHQASRTMLKQIAASVGVEANKMVDTVSTMGNLVTANVPINLHLLRETGELTGGDKVLVVGGGSGLAVSHVGLVWEEAA
jgi:3-oxoacyl-(acyl-carrier-protein) synthase III